MMNVEPPHDAELKNSDFVEKDRIFIQKCVGSTIEKDILHMFYCRVFNRRGRAGV